MTVAELIDELMKRDQNAIVSVYGDYDIETVSEVTTHDDIVKSWGTSNTSDKGDWVVIHS